MLTRISLIIVILAGVGSIVLGQLQVKKKILATVDARDRFYASWQDELDKRQTAERQLEETRAELDTTLADLAAANEEIATKNQQIASLNSELESTRSQLARVRSDRDALDAQLVAWNSLGLTVEDVRDVIDRLTESVARVAELEDVLEDRNLNISNLQARLRELIGETEEEVVLPAGLRGNIVAVDPKWNFVVIDIGKEDGLLVNGKMLVSRNGELTAKIRVVNVMDDQAVANVMPGWQLDDILEGDSVIY